MEPEPEVPQPIAELEELASKHIERDSGMPIVRMLLWLMMGLFLTVPMIFMGVYVKNELRKMDQKRQKATRTVVEVKKTEPEIPDNIDWQHPDWSKFGEWTGTGGGKFGPITIDRSRLKFVMEVSPSRRQTAGDGQLPLDQRRRYGDSEFYRRHACAGQI